LVIIKFTATDNITDKKITLNTISELREFLLENFNDIIKTRN
jgi:hypothetical protein